MRTANARAGGALASSVARTRSTRPSCATARSASPELVRELEEFGLVVSRSEAGERLYRESEADIVAACARLARFGIDARHLRTFLTAAGRQAALVEQLVAPGLRSRNPERRTNALQDLESLARVAQELSHLLFVRDLRGTAERTS